MRVAVSGATGYLGSHLIIALLEKGNSVLAITRKMNDALGMLLLKYPLSFSVCELISDDLLYDIEKFSPQAVYSTTCCYETDVKFLEKRPRPKSWCKLKEPKALVSLYNVIAKKTQRRNKSFCLRYRLH